MPPVCSALLCLVFLLVPLAGHAAQPPASIQTTGLLALEQTLFRSMHEKAPDEFDRLLSADFVQRGTPDVDRDTWITNALTHCWGNEFDITDFHTRAFGTSVVVSFDLTFHEDPDTCAPGTFKALITDVWVHRDLAWRLAVRHSGPAGGARVEQQYAREPDAPPVFEARAELSFVATGGNTSTETLGLGAEAVHRGISSTTTSKVAFVRSKADARQNARSLALQVRHGSRLSERVEAFARGSYRRDLFAGVEHLGALDAGLSYGLRGGQPHALKLDVGLGTTSESRLRAEDKRFLSTTTGVTYTWTLSAATEVVAETLATLDLSDFGNWRATGDLSVLVGLNRILSARVSYSRKYLNRPVPGFQASDTTTSAALVLHYRGTR